MVPDATCVYVRYKVGRVSNKVGRVSNKVEHHVDSKVLMMTIVVLTATTIL